MSAAPVETLPETTSGILDRARAAHQTELAAAADLLAAAAAWGEAHPCPTGTPPAGWGAPDLHGEGLVPLAGDGAPLVAEFAPAELGAHLGLTTDAAARLIGEGLELKHRLTRLWQLVTGTHHLNDRLAGARRLPAWRARRAAAATMGLDAHTANLVDRWLAHLAVVNPNRLTTTAIEQTVACFRDHADPDRAEAKAQADAEHRHVTLTPRHRNPDYGQGPVGGHVTEVVMLLDTPDAVRFDNTVAHLATSLGVLGDTNPLEIRRATAVGLLADPQHALDLLAAASGGRDADTRPRTSGSATLYLHLDAADPRLVESERHGTLAISTVRDWLNRLNLGGGRVTIRPVIDLSSSNPASSDLYAQAVDAHDPPESMREAAVLRDACCLFPGCTRDSRHADLDHRVPYVPTDAGGPPGQTSLDNLGPLCRRHHRLKTHHHWHWQRTNDHTITWTTPDGTVIHTLTQRRHH
ncbi:HNH endonuclease [Nocardioides mangrovicus]|uniref:HNH endonuclease n=1 Tax=Nocardioides mangrovicus TaxID=2478913 RepID=A0A3L8P166_9ACTN|nr:HNH endonuclease signature motif containing protein [Nocardioides mangrovicus]RLV48874.1 HNH endonuclease [Nocardioides mangrovicus]